MEGFASLADESSQFGEYLWEDDLREEAAPEQASSAVQWSFHSGQLKAWQAPHRFKVIVAGRRWGKSEVAVRWMLHGAYSDHLKGEGGVSYVILPTFSMARPLWRKFVSHAPREWGIDFVGTENSPSAILVGSSRIEFKSGSEPSRIVGEGLKRVLMDECGKMKDAVWTEAIRPTLMDHNAPALFTGTPKGRNFFFRLYAKGLANRGVVLPGFEVAEDDLDANVGTFGGPSGENSFIFHPRDYQTYTDEEGKPYLMHPEIHAAFTEMPRRMYEQEILAQFLGSDGYFRGVREAIMPAGTRLGPIVCYGIDVARTSDWTVVIGMDAQRRVVFFYRFRNVDFPRQKAMLVNAIRSNPQNREGIRPKVLIDATGMGLPIYEDLRKEGLRVEPFVFTAPSKLALLESLALGIEQKLVGLPDEPVLVNELEVFEEIKTRMGGSRLSAPEGMHDDCVMALALCYKAADRATDSGITFPPEHEAPSAPDAPRAMQPQEIVENPDCESWAYEVDD